MKFTTSTMLSTSALLVTASAAVSTTSTYQLRVSSSKNSAIQDSFLALKDENVTSEPNALGVWSTGEPRSPYQFKLTPSTTDARFYQLTGTVKQTQLIIYGNRVAMGLFDVPIGANPRVGEGEGLFSDKWTFLDLGGSVSLRHAQDFNSSETPTGGAGSWRACKGDSAVDYQLYWYDGK